MKCVHAVLSVTLIPLVVRAAAVEVQKQVGSDKLFKLPKDSSTHNTVVPFSSVELPEGKLMQLVEDDTIDPDTHKKNHLRRHNSQREMRLNAVDPSGLIVKFEDCTRYGDNALVEVCLDYNDGVFGEACGTYVVEDYHAWVKFKNDYIFQKMLTDFCHVCHEECDYLNRKEKMPAICNIQFWADDDVYCNTLCDHETSLPLPDALVANCYGSSTRWSDYYFKVDCATQKHHRETGNTYYNPDDWDRNRDLEVRVDTQEFQTVDGEDCFLSDWWDMWIRSCDQAGYPDMDSDVAYPMGNAYLHCSLEEDEDGEDKGGKDILGLCNSFYNSLRLCHRASNTYQRWWGPESEINMASNETCEPLQIQDYGEGEYDAPSRDENDINGIVVNEPVTTMTTPSTNSSAKETNRLHLEGITMATEVDVKDDKRYCFVLFLVGCIIGGLLLRVTQYIIRYVGGKRGPSPPSSTSSNPAYKEEGEEVTTVTTSSDN